MRKAKQSAKNPGSLYLACGMLIKRPDVVHDRFRTQTGCDCAQLVIFRILPNHHGHRYHQCQHEQPGAWQATAIMWRLHAEEG